MNALDLAEKNLLPDSLIRWGIRRRLNGILATETAKRDPRNERFKAEIDREPIARDTEKANEQHYELPAPFFEMVLGQHLKYSSAFWSEGCDELNKAEDAALQLTAERVDLVDGMRLLDLGCGWGSFSLWAAERFPSLQIVAVSNSNPQREFILKQAKARGISHLQVYTADMNFFDPEGTFDRIVSVEMLEHMRNYTMLFKKIASWLKPDGRFFAHVFSHREYAYAYDADNPTEWMARYFFTGGIMPSHSLLPSFDQHLHAVEKWRLEGTHYQKTAEAWIRNFDRNSHQIRQLFDQVYGSEASRWMGRWRLFFLACAELFGYRNGSEWGVSHYLFQHATSDLGKVLKEA